MTGREMSRVLMKIQRYWPEIDPGEILNLIDQYGTEEHEKEIKRVQLAILKLSGGERSHLPKLVDIAKTDYRDVLAYAEYPEEIRASIEEMRKMSIDEVAAMRHRDRQQYLNWLEE